MLAKRHPANAHGAAVHGRWLAQKAGNGPNSRLLHRSRTHPRPADGPDTRCQRQTLALSSPECEPVQEHRRTLSAPEAFATHAHHLMRVHASTRPVARPAPALGPCRPRLRCACLRVARPVAKNKSPRLRAAARLRAEPQGLVSGPSCAAAPAPNRPASRPDRAKARPSGCHAPPRWSCRAHRHRAAKRRQKLRRCWHCVCPNGAADCAPSTTPETRRYAPIPTTGGSCPARAAPTDRAWHFAKPASGPACGRGCVAGPGPKPQGRQCAQRCARAPDSPQNNGQINAPLLRLGKPALTPPWYCHSCINRPCKNFVW